MSRLPSKFALPLLAKELTERAARKSTYVARVVFAALLMGWFGYLLKLAGASLPACFQYWGAVKC